MRSDVAIVGGGSAGAALALFAARRGLSVVCVEQRALSSAGARWVNDVPLWAFEEAGLEAPRGDEAFADGGRYHLFVWRTDACVRVRPSRSVAVDMRSLCARLQAEARDAGAVLVDRVRVLRAEPHALVTTAEPVHADVVVDASGISGAGLLGEAAYPPALLCAAAQAVHAVQDPRGARAFFRLHGADEGDTVAFGGVHGGFSVLSARLVGNRVALLAGSVPAEGHPAGRVMLRRFASEHAWIGAACFGGARAIPLGGARRTLARESVALLGDAAGQVFPAHASGVGVGLVAARLLADAIADGRGTSGYARAWSARFGRLFSYYTRLFVLTRRLVPEDVAALVRGRVLDEESVLAALEQRMPRAPLGRLLAGARTPRAIARIAWSCARRVTVPAAPAGVHRTAR